MEQNDPRNDQTRSFVVLTEGTMVSHYRIVSRIGAGGMGEVFLAEDTRLKRRVALKFLPHQFANNEEIKTRFTREAQAVATLNHPNIVTIHDVGEFDGLPYFVMEHVEGQSLHHFAHDEPIPVETVLDYAIQICQGIAAAHRAGIVHRDVKASNVVVDSAGRARLLDFGLATSQGDDKLTRTGSTLGTVAYMSPEQVSGRKIDHRSDLFSFGVVLYELIAGRTPFRRDNEGATMRAIIQDMPEPLNRFKSGIPDQLQQIVDKLLEKDIELRYQSAEGVIADLKRLVYDSQPSNVRRHAPPPKKSISKFVWGIAGLVALSIAGYMYFAHTWSSATTAKTKASDSVRMIAVLPFENLGNPEDEYFADGMTEEITSRLATISGLGVISRTSAMQYKRTNKSLGEIGKELGVQYVLEGSVRWSKVGNQTKVRITPQLIEVSDDRHLWADNYERDIQEIFAVQEEIAKQIVDQLDLTLLDEDRKILADRPTNNPEAYEYYLRGINGVRRADRAIPMLEKTAAYLDTAVALDTTFALAYAVRSRAYAELAFWSQSAARQQIAKVSFEKALRLQPDLAYGHLAAGIYYNLTETDYDKAFQEFNLAKSEFHGDADLLANTALVQLRKGDFNGSLENYTKAVELDPLNPSTYSAQAACLRFMRSYVQAEQADDRAIALDPTRADWYVEKIWTLISRYGDWAKVRPVVHEALQHIDTLDFVIAYWNLGGLLNAAPFDSLFADCNLKLDSVLARLRRSHQNSFDSTLFYGVMALGYRELKKDKVARAFLDSAASTLEVQLKANPNDPFRNSWFGRILALQGACDRAVKFGLRGKELLSVNKCHW